MTIEHSTIVDAHRHPPLGCTVATLNQVFVADGSQSGSFKTPYLNGSELIEDVTTTGSPITLTASNTEYVLTNDGAGATSTSALIIPGLSSPWQVGTSQFEWDTAGYKVGDVVSVRVDLDIISNGANGIFDIQMNFAIGGSNPFTLPLFQPIYMKTASTHEITIGQKFVLSSNDILTNPMQITAKSDSTGDTVVVTGWFIHHEPRFPVYV